MTSHFIETVNDFNRVFEELKDTKSTDLVAFDVDQVLIDPTDYVLSGLGSDIKDKHFKDLKSRLGQESFDYLYSIIVRDRKVAPLDDRLARAIYNLHKRNVHTVGLTAFWDGPYGVIKDMSLFRVNQLQGFDFDFSPNKEKESFLYTNYHSPRLKRHPRLRKGVIHTSHVSKGDSLLAYLNEHKIQPSRVIFIDDQDSYLKQVQNACKKISVPFKGFQMRQSFISSQQRDSALDDSIAALQFKHLETHKEWLDDNKAKMLLLNQKN